MPTKQPAAKKPSPKKAIPNPPVEAKVITRAKVKISIARLDGTVDNIFQELPEMQPGEVVSVTIKPQEAFHVG